jgi:hypothetical protein
MANMNLKNHGPIDDGIVYLLGLEKKKKIIPINKITNSGGLLFKNGSFNNKKRIVNLNKITNPSELLFKKLTSEYNIIPETFKEMVDKYSLEYTADEIHEIYKSTQRSKSLPKGQILSVIRDDSDILETMLGYINGKNPLKTLGSEIKIFSHNKIFELKEIVNYAKSIESNLDAPIVIIPSVLEQLSNHTKPNNTYNSVKMFLLNQSIKKPVSYII